MPAVESWQNHRFHILTTKKLRKPKLSMLFGAGGVTRTHDLLITKCIGILHLTVFRDLGAFPLGILREVRPILLDHLDKLVLAGEPSAVLAFPLQNAPETPPRTVVNTIAPHGTYSALCPPARACGGRHGWCTGTLCRCGAADARPDWLSQPCRRF